MRNDQTIETVKEGCADAALLARNVVSAISERVRQKYSCIHPDDIPDHVNYSKIEKYLRSVNIEVTRRMFVSYLKDDLLPNGHDVINSNYSLYTHEQITYFILVDMFKPILPLSKVKVLFSDILQPIVDTIGLDATYIQLCNNIVSMLDSFESAVLAAIKDDSVQEDLNGDVLVDLDKVNSNIACQSHVAALCMARGALDFYMQAPNTLLP
ncbi:MAG: DUF1836 domain-containing protein [Eubacteriales bacterium]|nr:DUF1836 domain-containing protein [Eubacteriales bacterium]